MTVRGPIEPGDIGMTLAHDHLLCDSWKIVQDYAFILDDEAVATDEAALFRAAGGNTICDPTNVGLGRDAEALARISSHSGLNVVMGCGWYRERAYPRYVFEETAGELAERLGRRASQTEWRTRTSARASSAKSAPSASISRRPRSGYSARLHVRTCEPEPRS